jgi:hypothetical protein
LLYNKEKLLENGDKWEAEIAKTIEADYLCIPLFTNVLINRSLIVSSDFEQLIDMNWYFGLSVSCVFAGYPPIIIGRPFPSLEF